MIPAVIIAGAGRLLLRMGLGEVASARLAKAAAWLAALALAAVLSVGIGLGIKWSIQSVQETARNAGIAQERARQAAEIRRLNDKLAALETIENERAERLRAERQAAVEAALKAGAEPPRKGAAPRSGLSSETVRKLNAIK